MENQTTVRLVVENTESQVRLLVLEPWGGEYSIGQGDQIEVVATGDTSYPLRVELYQDKVILTSFESKGAMMTAYRDGKELFSWPEG